MNEEEMNQEQVEVADSGSDVQDTGSYENPEEAQQEQGYEGESDYMADTSQQPMANNSSSNSAEAMKTLHLFDLSQKLCDYGNILGDNLKELDRGLLDLETIGYLRQIDTRLEDFQAKTRDFIVEVFYKETYEKNLYIYLSLRHYLLTMVKFLRHILKLNTLNIEQDKK